MSTFDWTHSAVIKVIERYTQLARKATPQDCEASKTVRDVALYYASNYEGSFEYMVKMRNVVDLFDKLSPAQAAGVINCMLAEHRFNAKRAANAPIEKPPIAWQMPQAELPNLPAELAQAREINKETAKDIVITPACKNGTYTIVLNEAGDYRTLRLVDAPEQYNMRKGTQIAQYLSGPDNESSYTGFAFVTGTKVNLWKKFDARKSADMIKALNVLLNADRAQQMTLGEAYAIESGNCFVCGRKLTVPTSLHRGMGPKCAAGY